MVTDFVETLEDNRTFVERELMEMGSPIGGIVFVLLSKRDLAYGGAPSAARLPTWLPGLGGLEVEIEVRDSMRDLRLSALDEREVELGEVRARLCDVDRALLGRMRSRMAEHGRVELFRRAGLLPSGEDCDAVLLQWENWLDGLSSGTGYRVDVRHARSPLAMIVRIAAASSPDGLESLASLLQEALDLWGDSARSVLCVLYRPGGTKGVPEMAQQLLTCVFAAYNFTNAAAHPGEYPKYDLGTLMVVSRELRRGLGDIEHCLRRLN